MLNSYKNKIFIAFLVMILLTVISIVVTTVDRNKGDEILVTEIEILKLHNLLNKDIEYQKFLSENEYYSTVTPADISHLDQKEYHMLYTSVFQQISLIQSLPGINDFNIRTPLDSLKSIITNNLQTYKNLAQSVSDENQLDTEKLLGIIIDNYNKINEIESNLIFDFKGKKKDIFYELKVFYVLLMSILLAIALAMSYNISDIVSRPILKLKSNISNFIDNNLTNPEEGIKLESNNEISQLYNDYLLLKRKIATQINSLNEKNKEINRQNTILNKKNSQIIDGLEYARTIQFSLLPSEKKFLKLFPDTFILHLPRELVSGDFYFLYTRDNKVWVTSIDCTGHGVAAALMTIMVYTIIIEVIVEKKISCPSDILKAVSSNFRKVVTNEYTEAGIIDEGMDMGICCIDKNNNSIEFAGAFHDLIFIHNKEVKYVEGDIYSIGEGIFSIDKDNNFKNHCFSYNKGDKIYLFSDGYQDQFGGDKGRKYMKKPFIQLLIENVHLTGKEQKQLLFDTFLHWKGDNFQVDDILVIGIEL